MAVIDPDNSEVMMSTTVKEPPDGGYGWVVVFAHALGNFVMIPLMHCFGLIFKDTFADLNMTGIETSLVINLNVAFGKMTGLANGALLKVMGYRKVAMLGAFLTTLGVALTSRADSFAEYIIYYGLITSLGFGLNNSAYTLAVNTYFVKRKSKAIGMAVTMAGFGPILVPQLVTLLLVWYTPKGTTLIIGGYCAHLFVSAVLLQPVKYHMKKGEEMVVLQSILDEKIGLEASIKDVDDEKKKPASCWKRALLFLADAFDLDLCKDPVFLNILLGLGLGQFADMNFTMLTPFFLNEFGLTTAQIATFMSTLGVADIVFRFLAPYIGDYLRKPARPMYSLALVAVVLIRFSLLLVSDSYPLLLVIAGCLGISKGIRKVFRSLVIPTYVSLEKLAIASGMEMMVNGMCILAGGSIVGLVKDKSDSYAATIITINFVTLIAVACWSLEGVVLRARRAKRLLKRPVETEPT